MAANLVPGVSPASILAAALTTGTGPSTQGIFSADGPAFLPSMMTEVVWLPETAVFQCNFQILGSLISLGWATGNVTAVTGNYTALSTDAVILASAASGAITITLPDATQQGFFGGQRYTVVKLDATVNAVTVTGTSGQLINGASTVTLSTQFATTGLVFDTASPLAPDWIVWNGITALTSTLFTPTSAKTANYTANPADFVVCNVSSGSFTVTLPNAPANGTVVGAELVAGAGTNTVTVAAAGSDVFDQVGGSTTRTLKLLDQAGLWQYASGPKIWYGFATGLPLADLDTRYIQSAVPVDISGATTGSVLEVANTTSSPSSPAVQVTSASAGDPALGVDVSGDADNRFASDSRGILQWGSGSATADVELMRPSAGYLTVQPVTGAGGLTVNGNNSASGNNVLQVTNSVSAPTAPIVEIVAAGASDKTLAIEVSGDTNTRFVQNSSGKMQWGPGNATQDCALSRLSSGILGTSGSTSFAVDTAGNGLQVKEGSNAKQGTATLSSGSVTVSNTSVTSSSRIFVGQATPGGTVGAPFVSSVTAGTGFTIKSTSSTDTSTVSYEIFEPAP